MSTSVFWLAPERTNDSVHHVSPAPLRATVRLEFLMAGLNVFSVLGICLSTLSFGSVMSGISIS